MESKFWSSKGLSWSKDNFFNFASNLCLCSSLFFRIDNLMLKATEQSKFSFRSWNSSLLLLSALASRFALFFLALFSSVLSSLSWKPRTAWSEKLSIFGTQNFRKLGITSFSTHFSRNLILPFHFPNSLNFSMIQKSLPFLSFFQDKLQPTEWQKWRHLHKVHLIYRIQIRK